MAEIIYISGTLIIGGIVAYVAVQQHKTSRDNYRLNLYDRRFSVYEGAKNFISHVVQKADVGNAELLEFQRVTHEAVFMFDNDIFEYLKLLYDNGVELDFLKATLDDSGLTDSEKRAKIIHKRGELIKWFNSQFKELRTNMYPYMKFQK